MADVANVAGSTKAERMLDQLRHLKPQRLVASDARNLLLAVIHVAGRLGRAHGDDWGSPRSWYLARQVLGMVRASASNTEWRDLLVELFRQSDELDFLTDFLREETFRLGIFGKRAGRGEPLTTRDQFSCIRDVMFERYRALGIEHIVGRGREMSKLGPASVLFAWSQAGGRDEVVAAVGGFIGGDPVSIVAFLDAIVGRSRDSNGVHRSLDPDSLELFFEDPIDVVEQLQKMAADGVSGADVVIHAINDSVRFDGGTIAGWLEKRRAKLLV